MRIPPMRAPLLLCVALLSGASAPAEEPGDPSVFDLVTGQVAQHSRAYHEARATQAQAALYADCRNTDARLRLALARAQLGEIEPARMGAATPEPIPAGSPDPDLIRFVCREQAGEFGSAAILASRVLSRHPDAFGRAGDWVVRMEGWHAQPSPLAQNFLGVPYSGWKWLIDGAGAFTEYDIARLKALLTLYPDFSDGFLVLGDELCRRGAFNLACWSWTRALVLHHPAPAELIRRFDLVLSRERSVEIGSDVGHRIATDRESLIRAIRKRMDECSAWQIRFQGAEGVLAYGDPGLSPAGVETFLRERGIVKRSAADFGLARTAEEESALQSHEAQSKAEAAMPALPPRRDGALLPACRAIRTAAALLFLAALAVLALRRIPRWSPRRAPPLTMLRVRRASR